MNELGSQEEETSFFTNIENVRNRAFTLARKAGNEASNKTYISENLDQARKEYMQEESENAELRELLSVMHGEMVSCEDNGYICGGHKFDERMHKLGIEV